MQWKIAYVIVNITGALRREWLQLPLGSAVATSHDGQHVCFSEKFQVVWLVDLHGLDYVQASVNKKAAPLLAHY